MELWDAYDRDMKKIENMILFREKGVPDGFYHLISEILVRHTDGSFLVMQRDMSKHLGGKWEATAGGSALRGETSQDCAKRELAEETGIKADKLISLGNVIHDAHKTVYAGFLCITACDKNSIVLRRGETSAYKWISRDELLTLSDDTLASSRLIKVYTAGGN